MKLVRVLNKLTVWIFWIYIREMVEDGSPSNSACIGDGLWCLHTKADDCAIIFLVMYKNEDKTNRDEVEMQDHITKGNRFDHILNLVWIQSLTAVNSNQLSVLLSACVIYVELLWFLKLRSRVSGSAELYFHKMSCWKLWKVIILQFVLLYLVICY